MSGLPNATQLDEHLQQTSGAENVDNGLQVQLEEDGGGSVRQSRVETSGL